MKQLTTLLLFSVFGIISVQAQTIGHAKIKKADHFVWFGLDFSELQCVGRTGFTDERDVATSKVHSWNDLMITEHDKFDINGFFQKDEFHYDIASSERQNELLSAEGLVVESAVKFDRAKIEAIVKQYSSDKYDHGLGLVFVVEKFDKLAEEAYVHVTFFDITTKEIVQSVKYTGKPRGFGLRNYWAGAIYDIMDQLEDDYKKWMKKNK